jgi:hypothetical protein
MACHDVYLTCSVSFVSTCYLLVCTFKGSSRRGFNFELRWGSAFSSQSGLTVVTPLGITTRQFFMNAVTHYASADAEGKRLQKTPTTVGHALAGKYDPNKTRIWGHRTLERLRQGSEPTVCRNKFAEVALYWSSGLLRGVTAKGCGPQIFRSEGAVLGKFLVTLGVFCRCARLSEAASPLCTAVLEMLLVCP